MMTGRSEPTVQPPGREGFLRQLSERYRQPLTAYFRRRVGSANEAEDLSQEVFLRLVRRPDVERIDNPEAFLFRIAVNLLRDRSRRGKTRDGRLADATQAADGVEDLSPERVFDARQHLEVVLDVLAQLDERTRDAFILHRLEGMKHAQIAELYGVSVSSVEKYIIKALAALAERAAAF
jgi:RNA polymerase sigma factor (sigma-70 family)